MTDCIVVGGGVIGMLCARELAANGLAVKLLERGETGREASWAGGGILSPLQPWRSADPITALIRWSQARYPQLAEELLDETGIDPEWTPSGFFLLNVEDRAEALAWATHHGVDMRPVEAGLERTVEPALQTARGGALWLPHIAQIRNPRLVKALQASLLMRGVDICEHTPVTNLLIQDGRIQGVRTPAGDMQAERVIVAAGAWSAQLLDPLGRPIEVFPVRGQMLLLRGPPGLVRCIVMDGPHYLIPRRDGRIVVGSTVERVDFDKSVTAVAREKLHRAALALIPSLAGCAIEHHWAGLRPGSPEGIPLISEHPAVRGLYINAGHYRNGLGLGPASARLLTDLMLGHPPIVDPAPYRC